MTIVVTKATGGTAQPTPSTYVPPDALAPGVPSSSPLADSGLDPVFTADLLSACVAHERCGAHLYRSVAGRTLEADLRRKYERFGKETREHVAKLERLITEAGGDPNYVSPAARATERAAGAMLESTFMLSGSVDPLTAELVMLEAVMLAEAKDHDNWELLAELSAGMADTPLRALMERTATEVLAEEEEHFGWARDTRARLLMARATAGARRDGPARVTGNGKGHGSVGKRNGGRRRAASGTEMSRDELYAIAQEMQIPGRSQMTKEQLQAAVDDRGGA
jgi:rubrerythrin